MYIMCHGNFKKLLLDCSPIEIKLMTIYIYINFVTNNSGNKNDLSSPTKEVKYHYPDEITLITQ